MAPPLPRVLLTGATGYIGGRLLHRLERLGHPVRCLARRPDELRARVGSVTEVVGGDVLDRPSLDRALVGIDTVYYLVHSMAGPQGYESADRRAATNMAEAARAAGCRRIIYLGGLGEPGGDLSPHLRSRHDTGECLRSTGVEVIELRASIVIGAGSLSFEMIRALVERLPVMVTPRWVRVRAQPIAIDDVVAYLAASLNLPTGDSRVVQIGGTDVVTYGDLMAMYAAERGLTRVMIPVPLLTPHLSSLWLGLVTPLYARVGRELVESMRHPTVVTDNSATHQFPAIRPMGARSAIARALRNEDQAFAETRWSDALSSSRLGTPYGGVRVGSRLVDSRSTVVAVSPAAAFAPIRRIGGRTGWYFGTWLWVVRGWIDLLAGGVGLRRGRRDPEHVRPGDVLDWWRVEAITPDRHLRLSAEMRVPGRAWLDFEVAAEGEGARITQTATFDPHGAFGLAYWYGIWPLHALVFRGMLRNLARAAMDEGRRSGTRHTSGAQRMTD